MARKDDGRGRRSIMSDDIAQGNLWSGVAGREKESYRVQHCELHHHGKNTSLPILHTST